MKNFLITIEDKNRIAIFLVIAETREKALETIDNAHDGFVRRHGIVCSDFEITDEYMKRYGVTLKRNAVRFWQDRELI